MRGLEAEILKIIQDCASVTREQVVRHFVLRRNLYPDAVHKAIYHLIVGGVVAEKGGNLSQVIPDLEDKEEARAAREAKNKPAKEPAKKPAKPLRYNEDGDRRCTGCHQYLPVSDFARHPSTKDRLQPNCRLCKTLSMQRSRSRSAYSVKRLTGLSNSL